MKKIEVVAAIIVYKNEILCMQRGNGKFEYISYKYEFPGGKVEPGESNTDALRRELKEEMDMEVFVDENDFFLTVQHQYPDFEITMHSYLCRVEKKNFNRKEHIDHKWLIPFALPTLDWALADIPIVEKIMASKLFI